MENTKKEYDANQYLANSSLQMGTGNVIKPTPTLSNQLQLIQKKNLEIGEEVRKIRILVNAISGMKASPEKNCAVKPQNDQSSISGRLWTEIDQMTDAIKDLIEIRKHLEEVVSLDN